MRIIPVMPQNLWTETETSLDLTSLRPCIALCAPKEPRKGTPPGYFGTLADGLGPFLRLVSADRACPTRKGFPSQEFAVEDTRRRISAGYGSQCAELIGNQVEYIQ